MPITLYGLKNCDSCKKALKALHADQKDVTFIDIREYEGLVEKLPGWLEMVEVKTLLNTRSTTWRGLSDEDKALAEGEGLIPLILSKPTLIKRPVIEQGDQVYVGWNKEVQLSLV